MPSKSHEILKKKVKPRKEIAKEIILKADRAVFAHIIVLAEVRELSTKEVLAHPPGPLPWLLGATSWLSEVNTEICRGLRVTERCSGS